MTTNSNASGNPEGNAILVDAQLVAEARSALKQRANSLDRVASDREIVNFIVTKMARLFGENIVYRKGPRGDNFYKWFGSEESRKVSSMDLIDKGRFVDACLIAYLYGVPGMEQRCVSSRVIRPRNVSPQEAQVIAKKAAEIAEAKYVDSEFVPCTLQLDK